MGASKGWSTAYFLGPFCAAWPLGAAFFLWEWKLADDSAVLPASIWRIPNIGLMCFVALYLFSWIAVSDHSGPLDVLWI